MNLRIFVVDVKTTLEKWREKANAMGKTNIQVKVGMDSDARRQIGNYKPLILSSPDPDAKFLSGGYALHFTTSVEVSYLLQKDCVEFENPSNVLAVWNSLDTNLKNKYRVAIFFPHP